jgi:hypothetical protein
MGVRRVRVAIPDAEAREPRREERIIIIGYRGSDLLHPGKPGGLLAAGRLASSFAAWA